MTALVLLPGMDSTSALRDEFIAALAPTTECIVVGYPAERTLGYGELEVIVRSKLPSDRPYVLLGESFSGPIAISIAASRPPGLVGLILCCSFARNPRPMLGTLRRLLLLLPLKGVPIGLISYFVLGRFATASLQASLRTALSRIPEAILKARITAALRIDVSSLLSDIRVPLLYLRGSQDRIVPRSCADAIVRGVPERKAIEINAPHFLLQAAPVAAAKAVGDFLTPISARQA
jgi:pimeloyl-ACP methyl ester carboxylesterase